MKDIRSEVQGLRHQVATDITNMRDGMTVAKKENNARFETLEDRLNRLEARAEARPPAGDGQSVAGQQHAGVHPVHP